MLQFIMSLIGVVSHWGKCLLLHVWHRKRCTCSLALKHTQSTILKMSHCMIASSLPWTELFLKLHIDFLLFTLNLPGNDLSCPARTPVCRWWLSFTVKWDLPSIPEGPLMSSSGTWGQNREHCSNKSPLREILCEIKERASKIAQNLYFHQNF